MKYTLSNLKKHKTMNTKLNVVVLRINNETGVTQNVSIGYAIKMIGCLWNDAEELLLQGYSLNFYPYSYKLKQNEKISIT